MKKILITGCLLCSISLSAQEARDVFLDFTPKKEKYQYTFSYDWRVMAGYVQDWQHSPTTTYPDTYLHGASVGATVDFNLPYNLSIQTGLVYALTYGVTNQHWRSVSTEATQVEILKHKVMKHSLDIPIHLYYRQKLWRELALVFYGGPKLQAGIWQQDNIEEHLTPATLNWLKTNNIQCEPYNKYKTELLPFNLQISLGGGIEWGPYRLQAGYDFGLLNLVRNYPAADSAYKAYMREWSWNVIFAYRF